MSHIENVPTPPREIPRWFFIRRMQALVFTMGFMIALGFAMIGVAVLWSGYPPPGPDWALNQQHREARARITGAHFMPRYHYGNRSPWEVRFVFETSDGRKVATVGYTLDPSFGPGQVGQWMPIEYDSDRPTIARPVGGMHSLVPWWIYPLFGQPLILGFVLLPVLGVKIRRERDLLVRGEVAEGHVVEIKQSPYVHFNRARPYDITYTFRDFNRQERRGRDRTYHYAWAASLREGDPVVVIHDAMDGERNVLWIRQPGLET
ncbi:MAG: hypothetical protein JXQ73_01830 [Phycisphaerae bacterium]|nr:hypothetical protein [Phycisphaerae bacterium]